VEPKSRYHDHGSAKQFRTSHTTKINSRIADDKVLMLEDSVQKLDTVMTDLDKDEANSQLGEISNTKGKVKHKTVVNSANRSRMVSPRSGSNYASIANLLMNKAVIVVESDQHIPHPEKRGQDPVVVTSKNSARGVG